MKYYNITIFTPTKIIKLFDIKLYKSSFATVEQYNVISSHHDIDVNVIINTWEFYYIYNIQQYLTILNKYLNILCVHNVTIY